MIKFLLLVVFIFILSGCHGCTFIKQKLEKVQDQSGEQQQQEEQQPMHESEPIPTNPQHS